jgi:hypothetical protein
MIYANGINGATGGYISPSRSLAHATSLAASGRGDPRTRRMLQELGGLGTPHLGLSFDLKPEVLAQAGWAVVFHQDEDIATRKEFARLVEHRRNTIGKDSIVRILDYRNGETARAWLGRYDVAVGGVNPEKVPFYLLLVGPPGRIPFDFGYVLDVEYAVGRVDFDSPNEYAAYIEGVIKYETETAISTSRRVIFFGPKHGGDPATESSAEKLVRPLAFGLPGRQTLFERVAKKSNRVFDRVYLSPAESRKANLIDVLRSAEPAAVLFTASHGLGWPIGHPRQTTATGALLCQDYSFGASNALEIPSNQYFAATDVPPDANVHGMVCFHFACFGAGCPEYDRFPEKSTSSPGKLAPRPFFSALPKRLLTHSHRGALAVFGHVERVWGQSFETVAPSPQIGAFENALGFILLGYPLGFALRDFNERYATSSAELGRIFERQASGDAVSDSELTECWLERNNAESFILFGDPGIQLRY